MTYFFETYGCQMNQAESAAIENYFIADGWQNAPSAEDADMVIINTCSVRATAETRVFGRLGYFKALKQKKTFVLAVVGCMAERLQSELRAQYPFIDYVIGNFQKQYLKNVIAGARAGFLPALSGSSDRYNFAESSWKAGTFSSYVPIMHGCNNYCSYCIVPYVRGREISRSPQEIYDEIDLLEKNGVKEITLLGQNVNSYRFDGGERILFPRLLGNIAKRTRSVKWLRFLSSHPKDLSDDLIDVIARESAVCKHIHLPMQHGSTRILQAMNRGYTREQYVDLVEKIRKSVPGVSLSTDILIGFPGETESDLEQTLQVMKEIRCDYAYMYHYNPREGTAAYEMTNRVPEEVKLERLSRVIELQQTISKEALSARIGTKTLVLAESVSRDSPDELIGRTERDARAAFKGGKELIGSFVNVELTGLRGNTFRAKII